MTDNPATSNESDGFDYIIVGAGAGGAPLAARLARAGKKVLVIEAGPNHTQRGPLDSGNEVSRVPLLHGVSSEHSDLAWRFFVDHYGRRNGNLPGGIPEDPKWHKPDRTAGENETHEGIFYPRAAGIGGCTIHNAMITIAGPDSDWDDLAGFLGDPSWNGRQMRKYFQRVEHNDYLPAPDRSRSGPVRQSWSYVKNAIRFLFGYRPDLARGRHGFDGWLHTSFTDLSIGLEDKQLVKMLAAALRQAKRERLENAWSLVRTFLKGKVWQSLDPNHAETQATSPEGVVLIPLSVYGGDTTIHQNRETPFAMLGRRSSPREFLLETLALYPDYLTIWSDCLVTKVILEDDGKRPRAVGVELLRGERLFRAHVNPSTESGQKSEARLKENGEVILCGGAFNTPQLLMLSGIGDPRELKSIADPRQPEKPPQSVVCQVELPGVGKNLQDRYEVSVVCETRRNFSLLDGATLDLPDDPERPDRHLKRWREEGTGLYTSNGAVLGIFKRSRPDLDQPDLFIFGIPSEFRGYSVGYSKIRPHDLFTWVILKSHTRNPGGYVLLRSTDPLDTPRINFQYFGSGVDTEGSANHPDVLALLQGVKFVRGILRHAKSIVKAEVHPGTSFSSDSATNEWIRRDAWGHHACGTCRMGPDGDPDAVLDSRFRVRGVANLRVVDTSIFPDIPGYFIVANIYMASEKAADVILEDANRRTSSDRPEYPTELRRREGAAIAWRRRGTKLVQMESATAEVDDEQVEVARPDASLIEANLASPRDKFQSDLEKSPPDLPHPMTKDGQWQDDVTGLALSGGGIRSATLSLGVLQSLARRHLLRRVDFLSTASGGGYIGSFLGRFYDRLRLNPTIGKSPLSAEHPADQVEQELVSPTSPMLHWLRSHGNYIAPNGRGDGRLNFAVFVRNLLSVHFIVGLAIFAAFGIANAIRYGLFDKVLAGYGLVVNRTDMPIGHLVQALVGPWFSPWFMLVELLLLFLVLPRIIGYWIVSQDRHESFKTVPLVVLFFLAGLLLYFGVSNGLRLELVVLGLALLSSLIQVEMAWRRGRVREAAVGTGGVETQRLRTRNYLSYDLGLAFALAGVALAFTLIDTFAHGLQEWKLQGNVTYMEAFAALGAAIMAGIPVARWLAEFFRDRPGSNASPFSVIVRRDILAGLLAVVLFTLPLLFYGFASHAIYHGGNAVEFGILTTALVCILTITFAHPSALTFVNRSSLSQTYSARLARAYLGASNPARHRPEGINVTEVIPGDDLASIRDYRPHEASGPLHLINVTINQTVDYGSRLRKRDRQGTNMAVSCLGVTVGESWHSAWADASSASQVAGRKIPAGLEPIGCSPAGEHPLVDQLGRHADRVEMLSLRQWVGISGAAVDPGRGRTTNSGTALLMGLVNMRTGHWWDSGISAADRGGFPIISFMRRVLYLIPRFFATQSLLLFEWLARYPGPWERFWHISDGGFFDNSAGYELVRRRVPRIIVCDGTGDPSYDFNDFAELIRKARIDFDARIEAFTNSELNNHVPSSIRHRVGTLGELRPQIDALGGVSKHSQKHAALFWVHYPSDPMSRRSILLLLKASLTGDESSDVLNYYASRRDFPHEATADQSFDEAQWESYRKLGEHVGTGVFVGDWFWRIPLPAGDGGPA